MLEFSKIKIKGYPVFYKAELGDYVFFATQKEAYFRLKTQPAEYAIKAQKVKSVTTAKKICKSWALNIAYLSLGLNV